MTDYSKVTLQELLRREEAGLLCKQYNMYVGTLIKTEYKADANLRVGGDCLKVTNTYTNGNKTGRSCSLVTWTQEFEDGSQPQAFENLLSVDFDGINDYISIANPSNFHFESGGTDQPWSISMWIKATGTFSSIRLASKGAINNTEWIFSTTFDDRLNFALYKGAANNNFIGMKSSSTLTADLGFWIHVVGTYDATMSEGGIKLYKNGAALGLSSASSGSYTGLRDSGDKMEIGRWNGTGVNFTGNIDEVSVWNKELSAAEVTEIYNLGVPKNLLTHSAFANIVMWLQMGDNAIFPVLQDQINGNDGTMINMSASDFETDVPSNE